MKVRIYTKVKSFELLIVALCAFCNMQVQALNSNESEAWDFLNQTSDKMFSFFNELAGKNFVFDLGVSLNPFKSVNQYKPTRDYISFVNKIIQDSKQFDYNNFKDDQLKYAFEVLTRFADEKIIGVQRYSRILESLKELSYLDTYKEIPKYDDRKKFLPFYPDVYKLMGQSTDEKEIQHYWAGFKKIGGQWAKKNLNLTIEALKYAAELSEMTPLEFWSRGFNVTEMEGLLYEQRLLYFQIHALFRTAIQRKFGESVIGNNRLIPDHLMRQVGHDILTNKSVFEDIFPYESVPQVGVYIRKHIRTKQLYEFADEFYASLGFEKYPASYWGDRIRFYNVSDDDDVEDDYEDDLEFAKCVSKVMYQTPQVFIKFCENPEYFDILESNNYMGYIYYAKEMVGLPAYFFGAPQNLDQAIGTAVSFSATTHSHLKKLGLVNEDFESSTRIEMNRIFKAGILRILQLPMHFVHAKLMADLLSEEIELKDINTHYWDLMVQYAGIKKPDGHETDTVDLPIHFYRDMNDNEMSREFTTFYLALQIHLKLCEISGQYPRKPLYLCDISGSKEAGDALKKLMKIGKSKPFWEVLAIMFPKNPAVSSDGILEYYRQLKNMLIKKNNRNNVKLGWLFE